MLYRTSDKLYMKYIARWYDKLLPQLVPLLYENGGPIIMAQVENEYGSYWACDFVYTTWLRDLYRKYLGPNLLLFTTDGPADWMLSCGHIDQTYPTIDFGASSNASILFSTQRDFASRGPLVNSEYYPGWFDVWGVNHQTTPASQVASTLESMLQMNASVNM